jgi:hypothetical protein
MLVVLQDGGGKNDEGMGVDLTQAQGEAAVGALPRARRLRVHIFLHDVVRVRVVLPQGNDDHVRRVPREIPRGGGADDGVEPGLVEDGFHAHVIGAIKPTRAVPERDAALTRVVQLRAELSGSHGSVGIPRVAEETIVILGVAHANVIDGLHNVSHRDGVSENLHPAGRGGVARSINAGALVDENGTEIHVMAAILALEDDGGVLGALKAAGQFEPDDPVVVGKPQLALVPVDDGTEVILHVALPVDNLDCQRGACETELHGGISVGERGVLGIASINPARVAQRRMVRSDAGGRGGERIF